MDTPSQQGPAWKWPTIRLRWALLAAGLFLVNALGRGLTVFLDLRASGSDTPWPEPFVWELTSGFVVWCLIPLAHFAALNAPWGKVAWSRFLALHLAAAVLFWAFHVLGMWFTRTSVYHLAGWGPYHYGQMLFRAPMEGLKDLLGFASLAAIFHIVELRRARQVRELAAARLEAELRDARLQVLSAQLDPHFLFNALNTLSSVMYEDLAKADRLLAALGQMLRDGLEAGGATWTLDQELAHLDHYLAFVEARFGDRVKVERSIVPGLGGMALPRFALQRLVENALKHNADAAGRTLCVSLQARVEGSSVLLSVADDGAGFGSGETGGVGLDNLRRSLELLHDARAELRSGNRPEGGAEVVLRLPREAGRG